MLHILPAETALHIVSHLPLQDLYTITLVSHNWNTLVNVNEPAVYRNAALLHRFLEHSELHADSISPNPKFAQIDWKAYCRRQLEIEKGWRGKSPFVVRELTATGTAVHRVKVDPEQGFVITTCQTGGLFVCDLHDNRVLWSLAPAHAVRYAHLEYDQGFIVFNRIDDCKEVWRHAIDVNDDEYPQNSPPDTQMLKASEQSARIHRSADDSRGHFRPWALLRMPEIVRMFRFSYPTLLASATNDAYVWDIPRGELVTVIRHIQRLQNGSRLGDITYVEVNDEFAFICGELGLRIFGRDDGALLYHLSANELPTASWDVLPQAPGAPDSILQPQTLRRGSHYPRSNSRTFMACHVSASGHGLVILMTIGRLVMIPGFRRLFSGSRPAHYRDISLALNFQPSRTDEEISYYLAVGGQNAKFAVATRKGVFVILPDFGFSRMTAERPPHPGVTVCRLSTFDNDRFLTFFSCLQLTHSGVYFNYPSQRDGRGSRGTAFAPDQPVAPAVDHWQGQDGQLQVGQQAGIMGLLAHLHNQLENTALLDLDDDDDNDNDDDNDDDDDEDDDNDNDNEDDDDGEDDDDEDEELGFENWFQPVGGSTVYEVAF